MEGQRNNTLEIIKFVASYMVVLIHFYFRDGLGSIMDALARFAVPLFFIVRIWKNFKASPPRLSVGVDVFIHYRLSLSIMS